MTYWTVSLSLTELRCFHSKLSQLDFNFLPHHVRTLEVSLLPIGTGVIIESTTYINNLFTGQTSALKIGYRISLPGAKATAEPAVNQ